MGTGAFEPPGRFWRGNVHTHSNRSDGMLDPGEVCRRYRDNGYDFLCLSDHFLGRYGFPITDTRPHRTDGFTTILGAELHAPANRHGEIWHVLAVGLPEDFAATAEGESGVDLAARARSAGAFIGIAHPEWSGLTIEDGRAMAAHAHSVEIFNACCGLECARFDGAYLLDQLLNEGHRLVAHAADDAHFKLHDGFIAWVMVKAEHNEPESLVAAMKRGAFYSSQGPVIHEFSVVGEEAHVSCSPVVNVALVGRGSRAVSHAGETTHTALPIAKFAGDWFRVVIADAARKLAWTNPVWLK